MLLIAAIVCLIASLAGAWIMHPLYSLTTGIASAVVATLAVLRIHRRHASNSDQTVRDLETNQ